jgi:hypothetical protein
MATRSRFMREIVRGMARFPNLRPVSLLATLLRAARLHIREPARPLMRSRTERVVVALTTIPARANKLRPVLFSLIDQAEPPDAIVLALPEYSRSGERYPDPATLGLPPSVTVVRCKDEGPATKLLPILKFEPNAVLVIVDDDVIYPRGFLQTLLSEHRRRPGAALGFRGVCLQAGVRFFDLEHIFATGISSCTPVDILFGTWGYLIPSAALGPEVHAFDGYPEQVRWVDDIWISGHLARRGVVRLVVVADELPLETRTSFRAALTSGINRSGQNDEIALKLFASDW